MHIPTHYSSAMRLALAIVALVALGSAPASAAVSTWLGAGTSDNFSDNANWDAPPVDGNDLVFSAAAFATRGTPNNDLTGLDVNAIEIYDAYVISGNAITCSSIADHNATTATISMPLATPGTAALTVTVAGALATLELSGVISGDGPLNFAGPGTKRLNGTTNNLCTGLTTVSAGTLLLDSSAAESIAGPLVIASGATARLLAAPEIRNTRSVTVNGTFDLSLATGNEGANTETIAGLLGSGTVSLGANVLGCAGQTSTTFSGGLTGVGGSFRQSSSGTQLLSGTSTNTGATLLAGGSIHVLGTHTTAAITVTAGTLVLANDCTVGDVVISNAVAASALSLNETSAAMNLHGTAASLTMGTGCAFQVNTKGAAATLYSNITTAAVDITGATLTVNTSQYTPVVGAEMVIISNTGADPVTGTFAGLLDDTTVVSATNAATTFTIDYDGGDGNDVTLTATSASTDTTAPVISDIASGSLASTAATITWATNEASTSRVEYGTTDAYGSMTTLDTDLDLAHSVRVTGLTPSTMYHYRVLSADAAGNLATSADGTFTTTAASTGGGGGGGDDDNDCGGGSSFAFLMLGLLMSVRLTRRAPRD